MKLIDPVTSVVCVISTVLALTGPVVAQDATEVDPAHYKVEFENDQVRVVRVSYGPGERSVMHEHPEGVVVFLTDHDVRSTYPDGKTEVVIHKTGEVVWTPGGKHLPQNISDERLELILMEMKTKPVTVTENRTK